MPGKIVTLAMFHDAMAAQMTRNRLADEGIPAMLSGETTGDLFGGMGGAFGTVHLQVAEEDLERATRLLDAWDGNDEEGEPADSTAVTGEKPGNRTGKTRQKMPSASDSPAPETGISSKPMPPPRKHDEDDEADLRFGPDDVASRAWKAAIIGLLLMPVPLGFLLALPVLAYSLVLLIRLMGMSEDLSRRGTRSLYIALAANLCAWSFAIFLLMGFRLY